MIRCLFLLLYLITIDASHFNGGTIRWIPIDPYNNSSSVTITIIQTYWWSYSLIYCGTDVPISTSGYTTADMDLACVAGCLTDGGYSNHSIDILTDCTSTSSALDVITSQRSKNVTLLSDAHFFLAYSDGAWVSLNPTLDSNLSWSIVTEIDLRRRPDGSINTPPVAIVISPQVAIVNTTINIAILVSDVDVDDDIRCRWSTRSTIPLIDECGGACYPASMPSGTNLSNCILSFQGPIVGIWYAAAIQVEDFINTTSVTPMSSIPVQFLIYVNDAPTCSDAPIFIPPTGCLEVTVGVSKSLNMYVMDLCDPNSVGISDIVATESSSGMVLGTLKELSANASLFYKKFTWTPQASQVGLQQLCMIAYTNEFVQSAQYCVTFVVITSSPPCATTTTTATTASTTSTTTTSTTSITTASTTSTTTTSTTSITTASTTSTTTTSTTSITTASTTSTTTTATTSITTTTTSTTSTTTTSTTSTTTTSTTSTTTTATTSTTTTSTTSTTTTSTTSITTTTTSTTSTTTTATTSTTTTSTTSITTAATTSTTATIITENKTPANASEKSPSWGLIAGILSVALPLALCTCCCLYRLLWSPAARRRQREEEEKENEDRWNYRHLTSSTQDMARTTTPQTNRNSTIEVPKKSYQVYNLSTKEENASKYDSTITNNGSILMALYNSTNGRRIQSGRTRSAEQSFEMGNAWIQSSTHDGITSDVSVIQPVTSTVSSVNEGRNFNVTNENVSVNQQLNSQTNMRSTSTSSLLNINRSNIVQPSRATISGIDQSRHLDSNSANFEDWSRAYLFGSKDKTGIPRIQKPS